MSYTGPERRSRRSFYRFHDGRVVAQKGNFPHTTLLYDGPERRKTPYRHRETWPEGLFGLPFPVTLEDDSDGTYGKGDDA